MVNILNLFYLSFSIALLTSNLKLIGQANDLQIEIEKLIRFDTDIDYKKTPGFIISVIDNDSTYYFSFGTLKKGEKINILKDDIFEIGSVSKIFTASLISILVNDGIISLSDKVNLFVPDQYRNPRLEVLTIADLISHQSGLPKRPSFFGRKEKDLQNPYENYSAHDLLKFYRDFIPSHRSFEYSHTNYALLEIIINKVTAQSFQDIMAKKIFMPLNMSNSFVDFPEKKQNVTAEGYNRALKTVQPWTFGSFKGSEGLKSTSADLVKFVRANMNYPSSGLELIFANNFNQKKSAGFNQQLSVSSGWHLINMNHFYIASHSGKTSGHSAFICLVRDTKTAVIILSNSSVGTEDLGLQILRMINYNWKRINS